MISLLRRWYLRHFSQPGTIEFALVLFCAFILVYYFMWLVGPLVVALCLAFCLDWPVEALQRRLKIKRHLASILVMIAFCSCVVFITVLVVPNVIKQGAEFYNSIVAFSLENNHAPKAEADASAPAAAAASAATDASPSAAPSHRLTAGQKLYQLNSKHHAPAPAAVAAPAAAPEVKEAAPAATEQAEPAPAQEALYGKRERFNALTQGQFVGDPRSYNPNLNLPLRTDALELNPSGGDGTFTLTVSDFDLRIAHELYDIVVNLPEPIPSMVSLPLLERYVQQGRVAATNKIADLMRTQLMPSVVNAFTWLVYLIIVPIFTFLMLYDKPRLQQRVRTFLLPNNQVLMKEFWPSLHRQIAGYIRGKILHIIIIACANTLAFMLMGVNYAMLLGVGVGLSVVIPYVGAVIIAVPVVLVAIFQFGFSTSLLWVLVIYTVIQLLDSNVLTPMLFSKAMNLDAFSILGAILIFGNLWGFWGVFFAIPLATFIKTLIVRWPNADKKEVRREYIAALHHAHGSASHRAAAGDKRDEDAEDATFSDDAGDAPQGKD